MSGTINTIPASTIVSVVPSVISGGGSALDLIGLFLSNSPYRIPIGSVLSFPTLLSVGTYFGSTSTEYQEAAVYFGGWTGGTKLPGALLFAQYNQVAVGAWTRGVNVGSLTVAQIQALTGGISVSIDGVVRSIANISAATGLNYATNLAQAAYYLAANLAPTSGIGPATIFSGTGYIGATFVATGSGIYLTVASVSAGSIHVGDGIVGTGVPGGTTIVSQTSGTTGGVGVYVTSNACTSSGATITANSQTLVITAVTTGTLQLSFQVTTGQIIESQISGTTGGVGTYTLFGGSQQFLASGTITGGYADIYYDTVSNSFQISSATTGASSAVGYVTGTAAAALFLTQAQGAVLSPVAQAAATPSTFMNGIVAQTQNWATLKLCFDPDNGSGNAQKQLFASWINSQNNRYLYAVTDTDVSPTTSAAATSSLGYILKQNGSSGTCCVFSLGSSSPGLSAFIAGFVASLDFTRTNGRATLAFKGQGGLNASVTSATAAANLIANGYSFYGDYATANQQFEFMYPGQVSGTFEWVDSYVNQIWLNNQLQLALFICLTTNNSVPYNPPGYGLLRAACLDPIIAALNFGAIRANVPLSAAQAAYVNNQAGLVIDPILSTQGWYLQILAAASQVRAARQTPPMTLWYMDGESVQSINLASILIQ